MIKDPIAHVKNEVNANHCQIQKIEEENVPFFRKMCHVAFVTEFTDDSRNVSADDQAEKKRTFSFCSTRTIGFENVKWP